uniref:Uncharacterized protein n=1 Tax=Avena sativa TaxID=4498 RepID=A0ACD5YKQ9_AVESA
MEGQGTTLSPAAAAPAISAVLDNDDLLCEILLRVAFPTSLVRAVLVCKRWLRLASAPAFLRRFRDLHPPHILGFYVPTTCLKFPRFVPIPQPPELADVVRRGSFYLNTLVCDDFDVDWWNGLLLLTYQVHNQPPVRILRCPLYPARHTAILPAVPNTSIHDGLEYEDREIFPNGSGDGPSYFYLAIGSNMQQTIVDVYVLQDNIWAIYCSTVSVIPFSLLLKSLTGDNKIYSMAYVNQTEMLFLLDLVSSSLSLVNFPEELDALNAGMSLADDSGVHLAHVKDLQIRIWLHKIDTKGVSNWFLVNTVCLREMCTNNMIPICGFEDADDFIKVHAVGENSEFVLLEAENVVYLFDIKRNVAKKVYEIKQEDGHLYSVTPFMMVWPPKFRVTMEGCDPKE